MYDSIRAATEQYGYDAAGRLVLTVYGYGETRSLEYDLRSRVTAEVLGVPGQVLFDVGYEYDLANRLIRTRDRAAQETLVEHVIEAGQIVETHYGNGLVRAYSYDARGPDRRLRDPQRSGTRSSNPRGSNAAARRIPCASRCAPRRRRRSPRPRSSTGSMPGRSSRDPGKRVFGWSRGSGTPRQYAYDELSNRMSVAGGDDFTYNAERNRLLAAALGGSGGVLGYSYDAAGFATSRGGVPITWTATGRIASYGSATVQWDLSGGLIALAFEGATRRFDLFGGRVESDASHGSVGALDLRDVSLQPLSGGTDAIATSTSARTSAS